MEDGKYVEGSFYFYAPNKGAPVFFAIAFAFSGLYHTYQCIHYKCWRITGFYVVCAVFFTAGFIVRELGAFQYNNLIKFIVSICLIYAAPPILELANYNILGRILYFVPYYSPIHPGRVLSTFAFVSFVIETLNGTGAAYFANQSLTEEKQQLGRALVKAALLLQVIVIISFLVLAGMFHRRCLRAGIHHSGLKNVLYTLYASTALLSARTIYRVVEFWSVDRVHYRNVDTLTITPMLRYEWYFYVFEATLMLCNQVMLNIRHPRKYLPESTKTYLAGDGVTEVTGPGYSDSRNFLLTLIDPLNVVAIAEPIDG
ncbi:hypothetical protein B0H67DRAFT_598308 [Lasiosphaeris hirsuta]|uniref:RTA1 domain protein n=1 Tax=Lasiosphaeris hirsuta TaxID=260670 RepID=A0AA40AZE3_9PEZI|nr:hypothetical protein B0H67DRAFT_598308 [Lasiosphaeris hirsuta]